MNTVTLTMDTRTERALQTLSDQEGIPVSEVALRLLRRAIREKRPRPDFDVEAVRAAAAFSEDDLALAESDREHRAALLLAEDSPGKG